MRETIVKLYKFSELSDDAKEKARDWYRGTLDYDWWDSVYDDAARIADILGIDLRQRTVQLVGGGTRQEPKIFFSGFSSQGDGACFEGSYKYQKGSVAKLKKYAPKDTELHRIAYGLQTIQKEYGYRLTATVRQSGHYNHSGCTEINVYEGDDGADGNAVEEIKVLLRDFMDWIYSSLEKEYEYLTSNESVDEAIQANEYEFTEDGERA